MNRRGFLQFIGLAPVAVLAVPAAEPAGVGIDEHAVDALIKAKLRETIAGIKAARAAGQAAKETTT